MNKVFTHILRGNVPPPGFFPDFVLDGAARLLSLRGKHHSLSSTGRVLTALRHKEPDTVPCTPVICGAGRQLIGKNYRDFSTDPVIAANSFLAGRKYIGGDIIIVLTDLSIEAADFGQKMIYPENSTAHPDYDSPRIQERDQYYSLERIELNQARRMQYYLEALSIIVDHTKLTDGIVSGFVFGLLGVLNMVRGSEQLFKDCLTTPPL